MTMLKDAAPPVQDDGHPVLSWWIFSAWLNRGQAETFIYGCAARCFRAVGWSRDFSFNLAGGDLMTAQRTMTEAEFGTFEEMLQAGAIRPATLIGRNAPEASVAAMRTVTQAALGQNAARAMLYYSLPELSELVGDDDAALLKVLSVLEDELGLPFKSSYAARLGNFEVFDLHPWLDRPQPFVLEVLREPGMDRGGPQTWEISRTRAFADAQHIAHFAGAVAGDVVVDRLITLLPGDRCTPVATPEPLDEFEFRLFDATGETLLHYEQHRLLNRISFALSPVHRQVNVEDDLSRRAAQINEVLGVSATRVQAHTTHRSDIGAPAQGSWRRFAENMEGWIAAHAPPPSEDQWFRGGIEGEVGVIARLNQLISGAQVRGAVLVDPWFGVDAMVRLVPRLASQDVHLTIVTSWSTVDPDTNQPLDHRQRPTDRLETALGRLEPFINPRLTVINVVDGRDQAFHDRYLLLYPHDKPAKVFLLSNSLNRAAGKWPFVISLLAHDVGREVERYIEGLSRGEDLARGKTLTVSFKWPADAP